VGQGLFCVGDVVNVEEDCAGNALFFILGPPVTPGIGQVVGRIHDHDVGRVQPLCQPVR
jgi:hypothetical protein